MSVFRVDKTKNYTVMSNYHLKDKRLSLKAKGLLSLMLSLPDNWDYSLNRLCAISKESLKVIRSTLQELEKHYYLTREKKQNNKGLFEYDYLIYEHPYTQNPHMDNPSMEKVSQLNTKNKDKLDKQIIDDLNSITLGLINSDFIEEHCLDTLKYNNLFNELLESYNYKEIIKATNYTVNKIKGNNFKDEDGNKIINLFGYFKKSLLCNLEKITNDIELDWSADDEK